MSVSVSAGVSPSTVNPGDLVTISLAVTNTDLVDRRVTRVVSYDAVGPVSELLELAVVVPSGNTVTLELSLAAVTDQANSLPVVEQIALRTEVDNGRSYRTISNVTIV